MGIKDHEFLPAKYLLDQVITVQEAEQSHLCQLRGHTEPIPFGALNGEWNKIKARMKPGDELRYFRTKVCFGLALIRKDRIATFIGIEKLAYSSSGE